MAEKVVNGFMKGMSKDVHYSLLDNQQYLHADNIRPISSGFSTTGAIENIKGNNFIGAPAFTNATYLIDNHTYMVAQGPIIYGGTEYPIYSTFICTPGYGFIFNGVGRVIDITAYGIPEDMCIIGGCDLRNILVLFATDSGQRSQIYRITLTGVSDSELNTLDILYDDDYNTDGSRLDFNINHRIKTIARHETPNIQKVYWTDGINPLRYINISRHSTITGNAYSNVGDYWGIDKFELLPKSILGKPIITGTTTGTISTGMVFYAYQLYIENGAESAISYISDPVHVVEDSDYYSNNLHYEGDGVDSKKSKGFIVSIPLLNNSVYDRLKLIRVHYASYNQVPAIYVAADIPINLLTTTNITLTDIGSVITELAVDEFNIDSTEIFICQELATKNNVLFAANIEKKEFTIADFDARVIRYKHYGEIGGEFDIEETVVIETAVLDLTPEDDQDYVMTQYWGPNSVQMTIYNFKEWASIPSNRNISNVICLANWINIKYRTGIYTFDFDSTNITIVSQFWNGTDLMLEITSPDITFPNDMVMLQQCALGSWQGKGDYSGTVFEYTYVVSGNTPSIDITIADINDINHTYGSSSILPPSNVNSIASWNAAGWFKYYTNHDGINNYNNPSNDADSEYQYIYQSDGTTLGAEGPNISIKFAWEDMPLDDIADTESTYYTGLEAAGSYWDYSSPLNLGKLTWQRDEVYRLFIAFKNNRGQNTEPKWIGDIRMPKMVDDIYGRLTTRIFTLTQARRIYPTILIRPGSWPIDAVSAQVYRVPRNKEDRQVVSQCLAYPFVYINENAKYDWYLGNATSPISVYGSFDGRENDNLIKLVSPEINITGNVLKSSNDYLEYLTNFIDDYISVGGLNEHFSRKIIKCRANEIKASFATNDVTELLDSVSTMPIEHRGVRQTVGGSSFINYNDREYINAMGSSGLVVKYTNNNWSAEGKALALVNYKNNCWNSQYGGLTYENKQFNNMLPCSDIIYEENITYKCEYGDTFINYFDVSTLLFDLTKAEGADVVYSKNESVYVPLESSINCNLLSTKFQTHKIYNIAYSSFVQETLGSHMFTSGSDVLKTFNQTDDMYQYNTVYSQQPLIASLVSIDESRQQETIFDTQIKASVAKSNGEFVDSWTKFGVNETIEVDSAYGAVNALLEYGHSIYFWQNKAFGTLSVNERSLIQDNNTAQLVLGTGGLLDRYDYISTQKGCEDKFSVTSGVAGIYWADRKNRSINRFAESLTDLTLQKAIKSILSLDEDLVNWPIYSAVQDKENNEILFTFINSTDAKIISPGLGEYDLNRPMTLCYNETIDAFTSEYSFIPYVYIPYKSTFLTNSIYNSKALSNPGNLLYIHNVNENIQARNNFYGLYYNDELGRYSSRVKLVFNPNYLSTKVFDNVFINGSVKTSNIAIDAYVRDIDETINNELCPIDNILFYNDYQQTGIIDLVYKTNLERRERVWSSIIPRNAINVNHSIQSANPAIENLIPAREGYQERMRDKYLVCEFNTVVPTSNTESYRIIIDNIGTIYRNSYR